MNSLPDHPLEDQLVHAAKVAKQIRIRVLDHTLKNNGGYLSQACSAAEILSLLYCGAMNLGPSTAPAIPLPFPGVPGPNNPHSFTGGAYNGPQLPELDRFIFSPVHYALVLYSVLIEVGRLDPKALEMFNQDGSTVELIGAEHSPGHEVTAGSLAQAISQAVGIALARKLKKEKGRVWVFMSDGEFQEGQTWEAINSASHYNLNNLTILIDANAQQCDGKISSVMTIEPLAKRLDSFGAHSIEVDGHDLESMQRACNTKTSRPLAIICRTDPCRDIQILCERTPKLHYVRFKSAAEFSRYERVLEDMRED